MRLPELNIDYGELYKMLFPPIRTKLLLTGIELRVFTHLSEPTSAEDIAKILKTHPKNTQIFLNALAASNLIHKKKSLYQNKPLAQTFLMEGSQTYIGKMLTFMAFRSYHDAEVYMKEYKKRNNPKANLRIIYLCGELLNADILMKWKKVKNVRK